MSIEHFFERIYSDFNFVLYDNAHGHSVTIRPLKSGVGNRPVITCVHLSQVDQIA